MSKCRSQAFAGADIAQPVHPVVSSAPSDFVTS